jgi:hypothetical protein
MLVVSVDWFLLLLCISDVSLSEENMAVVNAGQGDPHGPELAPVDTCIMVESVIIDKVNKPSNKKPNSV